MSRVSGSLYTDLGSVHVHGWRGPESLPRLLYVGHGRTDSPRFGHRLLRPMPGHRMLRYTLSGAGYASLDGQVQVVPEGYGFLYEPGDPRVDYWWQPDFADHWEQVVVVMAGGAARQIVDELIANGGPVVAIQPDNRSLVGLLGLAHAGRSEMALQPARSAGYVIDLLAELARERYATDDHGLAERCVAWMQAHYGQRLEVAHLADAMQTSREELTRAFGAAYGMGPFNYLTRLRIRVACRLLRHSDLEIGAIARQVGYDQSGFARAFRRLAGVTPGDYRRGAGGPID